MRHSDQPFIENPADVFGESAKRIRRSLPVQLKGPIIDAICNAVGAEMDTLRMELLSTLRLSSPETSNPPEDQL